MSMLQLLSALRVSAAVGIFAIAASGPTSVAAAGSEPLPLDEIASAAPRKARSTLTNWLVKSRLRGPERSAAAKAIGEAVAGRSDGAVEKLLGLLVADQAGWLSDTLGPLHPMRTVLRQWLIDSGAPPKRVAAFDDWMTAGGIRYGDGVDVGCEAFSDAPEHDPILLEHAEEALGFCKTALGASAAVGCRRLRAASAVNQLLLAIEDDAPTSQIRRAVHRAATALVMKPGEAPVTEGLWGPMSDLLLRVHSGSALTVGVDLGGYPVSKGELRLAETLIELASSSPTLVHSEPHRWEMRGQRLAALRDDADGMTPPLRALKVELQAPQALNTDARKTLQALGRLSGDDDPRVRLSIGQFFWQRIRDAADADLSALEGELHAMTGVTAMERAHLMRVLARRLSAIDADAALALLEAAHATMAPVDYFANERLAGERAHVAMIRYESMSPPDPQLLADADRYLTTALIHVDTLGRFSRDQHDLYAQQALLGARQGDDERVAGNQLCVEGSTVTGSTDIDPSWPESLATRLRLAEINALSDEADTARDELAFMRREFVGSSRQPPVAALRHLARVEAILGQEDSAARHRALAASLSATSSMVHADEATLTVLPPFRAVGGVEIGTSRDARRVVAVNGDAVRVLDGDSGRVLRTLPIEPGDSGVRLALDSPRDAACYGGSSGIVRCARLDTGQLLDRFVAPIKYDSEWTSVQAGSGIAAGVDLELEPNGDVRFDIDGEAYDETQETGSISYMQSLDGGGLLVILGGQKMPYSILRYDDAAQHWRAGPDLSSIRIVQFEGSSFAATDKDRLWLAGADSLEELASQRTLYAFELSSGRERARRTLGDTLPSRIYHVPETPWLAVEHHFGECVDFFDADTLDRVGETCVGGALADRDQHDHSIRSAILRAHLQSDAWRQGKVSEFLGSGQESLTELQRRLAAVAIPESGRVGSSDAVWLRPDLRNVSAWGLDGVIGIPAAGDADARMMRAYIDVDLALDDRATRMQVTEHFLGPSSRNRTRLYDLVSDPQSTLAPASSQLDLHPDVTVTAYRAGTYSAPTLLKADAEHAIATLPENDLLAFLRLQDRAHFVLPVADKDMRIEDFDGSGPSVLLAPIGDNTTLEWWTARRGKADLVGRFDGLDILEQGSARTCGPWLALLRAEQILLFHADSPEAPALEVGPDLIEELSSDEAPSDLDLRPLVAFAEDCTRLAVAATWEPAEFYDSAGVVLVDTAGIDVQQRRRSVLPDPGSIGGDAEVAESSPVVVRLVALGRVRSGALTNIWLSDDHLVAGLENGLVKRIDLASSSLMAAQEDLQIVEDGIRSAGPNHLFVRRTQGTSSLTPPMWVLLDLQSLQPRGRLLAFSDGCWLFAVSSGLYDSNCPGDIGSASWVVKSEPMSPYPVAAFIREYFDPGLLYRTLHGTPQRQTVALGALDRRAPKIRIDFAGRTGSKVALTISTEANHPFELQVRRNGHQVFLSTASALQWTRSGQRMMATLPAIELPTDLPASTLSVVAFNSNGVRGDPAEIRVVADPMVLRSPPRTFIVSVGAQQFEDKRWNLRFAQADARAMVDAIGFASGGAVTRIELSGAAGALGPPRKDFIRATLARLAGGDAALPSLRSVPSVRPEDRLVISYSGHGVGMPDGRFYLFPEDTGPRLRLPLERVDTVRLIEAEELASWLNPIDSENVVLIVDACESAASVVGDGTFLPAPTAARTFGHMAYNKGMRVLVASGVDAVALESSTVGHGLLTYALIIDGLRRGQADQRPVDNRVDGGEWLQYAQVRVPELAREVQLGQRPASRAFAVVAAPQQVGPIEVQRPRLFDFRPATARDIEFDLRKLRE